MLKIFSVVATIRDPIKGWIDNFNGPTGLLIAIGKGILKVTFTDSSVAPDYVCLDVLVKQIIVTCWKKGTERCDQQFSFFLVGNVFIIPAKMIRGPWLSTMQAPTEKDF